MHAPSAPSYQDQRLPGMTSGSLENNRMSTRHKGQRSQNYAAMHNNRNAYSPPNKRFKGENDEFRAKGISAKSKGSGLGFADSDEEREQNVKPFGHEETQENEEEGEHEQEENEQS